MQFYFNSDSPAPENLVRAQLLMQTAMSRLQKEFHEILSSNRGLLDRDSFSSRSSARSSVSDYSFDDVTGSEDDIQVVGDTIPDLRSIAECMISNGYGMECVKIYTIDRRSIIDEGIHRLGFERTHLNQIHKLDWEVVEKKITNWLAAAKIAVRNFFLGERVFCDQVFAASSSAIAESCFAEITKDAAGDLFRFPESVAAKCKKSPEMMFRILDMYEALSELESEIESIFSYKSTSAISQVKASLHKLCDAVRTMFSDFESAVQKDPIRLPITAGGIHPLTRYVMNYVMFMGNYSGILSEIFADQPFQLQNPLFESSLPADNPLSPITARIIWMILVLLCKLDAKAELYHDISLSYLFLTNNLHFIVSKVRNSNLQHLLGDEWVSKHEAKVRQYVVNYGRATWSKVVLVLPQNPIEQIPLESAKETFRQFNSAFETVYRLQREWVVPDEKMRENIKASVAKKIVPLYRAFYSNYQVLLRGEEEALLRFTPEDVEKHLSELFLSSDVSVTNFPALHSPVASPWKHKLLHLHM